MTVYREIAPPAELVAYVRHFGILENTQCDDRETTFKIIADGCPGLIFQEYPDGFVNHRKEKLPQIFVHGITTTHAEKTAVGSYRNIGIYFRPHAVKAIFGIDACDLTNSYADLNDIVKNDLSEQLLLSGSIEKKMAHLSNFLIRQLWLNKARQNEKIAYAVTRINDCKTGAPFSILSADLDIAERALERMFKAHVGISPKLFYRISRFQHALDRLRLQKRQSLTDVAHAYAYSDQSHYIRDFKEFTSFSPKQFFLKTHEAVVNLPQLRS
jgi:AraC-like DNA-binding protein